MLKAERALLVEFEEKKRTAGDRNSHPEATAAALAEIRRRITEIQTGQKSPTRLPEEAFKKPMNQTLQA